jgi:hypothetical protein
MKQNLITLAIWAGFGFLTFHLLDEHDAPEWAKDIFVFIAFSFGLAFIQQLINQVMKELD